MQCRVVQCIVVGYSAVLGSAMQTAELCSAVPYSAVQSIVVMGLNV